ncbi:MAG: PAS domain S-box protein [Candidatus Thorarchaeota archaeon]
MVDGLNESLAKSFIGALLDPVLVLDARGQIVIQNAACKNLFGYALKDIVGKHFIDWSLASTYSVKELRSTKKSFSAAIKEDKGFALEYDSVTKKGKSVHVLLSGSMLKDTKNKATHIIVILRDITEQKKTEEALELQRRWLDGTLSSIGDAVITTDTEAKVTFMNPVAENLTGWITQEAMGKNIREVFHIINELTRKAAENPVYRVLKEGITVGLVNHTVLISRDGREIPIDDTGTPIKTSDDITLGAVLIFRDITERRKAECIIGELVKELTCLFDISELTSELSVNGFVEGVVELIPPAWNYPEITCARIVLGDREFTTSNFRETSWKLAADIKVRGEQKNTIEVYYLEERPDIDVGPFLKEERNLINTLAITIGNTIERKRAEKELKESEERLGAFMDSATAAFFLWDSELNLLRVNPAGMKIISPQGKPEDIIGTNLRDITPDKSRVAIYEEVMRTGEPYFTTNYIPHPEFDNIHFNLKAFKVGESLGIITTDITELVQNERFTVLGQLGAGIGHELRNPLAAIKNAAYFLRMVLEEPTPEVKETIDIIEKEVVTSERIINSLLSYTRPRPATRRKVDINAVIAAALSNVTIPEKVEVVSKLDEGISTILANPGQLQQVFVNLMLNAFQAMPKGGRLVLKSWSSGPDMVEVSIADTGVGISQENVSKIFNPLFTTKAKGIGLGLAIVKTLIDGHDGTIDVQSEPDKGTTFTVRIPIVLRGPE